MNLGFAFWKGCCLPSPMSNLSDQYREMAAQARRKAEAATLNNVRLLHLRSAERLEQIVQRLENVAEDKARNDAAKSCNAPTRAAATNSNVLPCKGCAAVP